MVWVLVSYNQHPHPIYALLLPTSLVMKHTNIHCILYNVFSTMYTLSNSLQLTKSKLYGIHGIARRLTWAHYPDWPHHCLYNCPARCPWSWPWWWFWPKVLSPFDIVIVGGRSEFDCGDSWHSSWKEPQIIKITSCLCRQMSLFLLLRLLSVPDVSQLNSTWFV